MPTIRDALHHGAARLQMAGIDNPRLEARLLLAHALGKDMAVLLRDHGSIIDVACYDALLSRRAAREPFALIVGHREFWSLEFAVSPATLIPRADSETLIEAALAAFRHEGHLPFIGKSRPDDEGKPGDTLPRRVLDLGTGTGCLLLAALSEFPAAFGVGVDRAPAAARLAARNADRLGMAERAAFLCGDWAVSLEGLFDLILCNPPYIAMGELDLLMPDVARYEAVAALDGGPDGYAAYRSVIPDLGRLLAPGGIAILELGQGQAPTVASLSRQAGFLAEAHRDLSGIDRALVLRRPPP